MHWRDFWTLTKPRLNFLAVLTALAAYGVALEKPAPLWDWWHLFLGTAAVAGACGVLNQWWEAHLDARMARTRMRPIPAGRLSARQALGFGILLTALGLLYLFFIVHPLSAAAGALAIVTYIFFYTPLKTSTTFSTLVGAVPGAVPPLIGWSAAHGTLDAPAWSLFLILFLWQIPHFLAIGWLYREDYAKAGFVFLPVQDAGGHATGRMAFLYTLALIPAALLPALLKTAGFFYAVSALCLSVSYAWAAFIFAKRPSATSAHRLFLWSIGYVFFLFLGLLWDLQP